MNDLADIARRKFGEPNRAMSSRSELRFGRKGAVSVKLTGLRAGAWYDHEAGEGGWLTEETNHERAPVAAPVLDIPDSAASFCALISDRVNVLGTPAEAYLRSRGNTRFLPRDIMAWSQERRAIVFTATTSGGMGLAAQMVYLTPDGRKREVAGVTKRTLALKRHWHESAAMRLPGRGVPILCEGPETALAIWHAFDFERPVYACLGIAGLGALMVRQKRVTIAADGNAPGTPADKQTQRALANRIALGQRSIIAAPEPPHDWDDIRRDHGHAAVREAIAAIEATT